ncbi:Thiopurine S-methyltransferase [Marinomonas spartinae]|uniref:thiopurine S-methyltransferase n=1 Tax=Marinomonas spartinae TaxID=1792290 RepID=UPI000808C505|nr:thiopurine S-methyltransferase [Marinomonas spartinae]SBS38534.1 Thiopurine S-methyltransferase [Marinomonas spartinae]
MITNEFWLDRWLNGRIGFHQEGVNAWLVEYWPSLPKGCHVLVPLCGKSNDMIWLAEQGYQVTGIELSPLAVVQFLGDNDLPYETQQVGDLKIHTVIGLPLRIVEGDYFLFDEKDFDACYDRAAMIAIPEEIRADYVAHTKARLSPNATLLLVSTRHGGGEEGPPFSVEDDSIVTMWGDAIQKVASEDLVQANPQYKERGYAFFEESVWHILPQQS